MTSPAPLRFGAVFPQLDIGTDRGRIRDFAQSVAELGVSYLAVYDHVLGGDRASYPERSLYYAHEDDFHEVFVLLGYLAAVTDLELVTGVLVLPQRQTALVAKQAAEVDILTDGRFRLGVGTGWNDIEFEGLGIPFRDRGRRMEEQVRLLRALWSEPVVDFTGRYHRIRNAGIAPRPLRGSIPIWMGTRPHSPALDRIGRLADGVILQTPPGPVLDELLATIRTAAERAGRRPAEIGVQATVRAGDGDADRIAAEVAAYRQAGVRNISFDTMMAGLTRHEDHLRMIELALSVSSAP